MKSSSVSSSQPRTSGRGNVVGRFINELICRGAEEWKLSRTQIILILLIPFFVAAIGAGTALIGKDAYKWFTGEDRFAEDLQVVLWLATLVLNIVLARKLWRAGYHRPALLYALLAVGIVFLIGEELSWGQRIFGWETSEALKAINKQKEMNIHNIYGVGTTFKWIHLLIGAYGTFLPFLFLRLRLSEGMRQELSFLVPSFAHLPYFAAAFFWRIQANLYTPPKRFRFVVSEYSEVIELILAIAFLLFMLYQLRRLKLAPPQQV